MNLFVKNSSQFNSLMQHSNISRILDFTDLALTSYFCISVYFIIATLVVVAFDNLHSTEMK